jgi:hypothetical protein
MSLNTLNPTQTAAWKKLQAHFDANKDLRMQDLFAEDAQRVEKFHLHWKDFLLDYSKNRITAETMTLLHELAHLITFIRFGHRVDAHGKEWKQQFSELLKHFLETSIFPIDIRNQLMQSLKVKRFHLPLLKKLRKILNPSKII